MKKVFRIFLIVTVALAAVIAMLNISVTTRQGVDFNVHTIRIPLYLKILDFFDRHYSYKELTKRISRDLKDDTERVLKIFEWTHQNIRRVPDSFPILDDHVWHIIVRGYGANDQFSDVFTTLCNYANVDAFYSRVYTEDRKSRIPLSFVKIDKNWYVFDPYNRVYFRKDNGDLASVKDISKCNWRVEDISASGKDRAYYMEYFENLPFPESKRWVKAKIQSPINRLIFKIKKLITR